MRASQDATGLFDCWMDIPVVKLPPTFVKGKGTAVLDSSEVALLHSTLAMGAALAVEPTTVPECDLFPIEPPRVKLGRPTTGPMGSVSGQDTADDGCGRTSTFSVSGERRPREASTHPILIGSGRKRPLGFRLRRRGLDTRRLEKYLERVGDYTLQAAGGQTSSFVVGKWLAILRDFPGGKMRSAHRVELRAATEAKFDKEGNEIRPGTPAEEDWILEFECSGNRFSASLALYVKLLNYVTFRQRHKEMPAALRVRAVQKAKELDMSESLTALVLPGTITLAMLVTYHEVQSWDAMMGGYGGHAAGVVSGEIARSEGPTLYRAGSKLLSLIVGGRSPGRVLPEVVK
jgi:hypothetical protein